MKHKHIPALVLALILSLSLAVTSYAASSTTASVPVTLTVKNEYRAVNVTVPAALPVHVINGTVVVADNARIINNSATGAVKVTSVCLKRRTVVDIVFCFFSCVFPYFRRQKCVFFG